MKSMEKKQTAVEWLVEQIEQHQLTYGNSISSAQLKKCQKQALAMEREQIEEAYLAYRHNRTSKDAEDYYTETYGK